MSGERNLGECETRERKPVGLAGVGQGHPPEYFALLPPEEHLSSGPETQNLNYFQSPFYDFRGVTSIKIFARKSASCQIPQ